MNRKLRLNGFLALAFALALMLNGSALFGERLQRELHEAKEKYERLYREYTQSMGETISETQQNFANELQTAKRRYDELKQQLSLSQTTKDSIKENTDKVIETVEKVFATGDKSAAPVAKGMGKTLAGYEDQKISIDGSNYCGQFAMTSVMHGMGIPGDPQTAYKESNPAGIFTAPTTITEYLNMNGVAASQKHGASIADIVARIDEGKPVMVLLASGDSFTDVHWVTIYGYNTDEAGNVTGIMMRDSYWGKSSGFEMDIDRFTKAWAHPMGSSLPGNLSGYNNLMIDIQGQREDAASPSLFNFNFHTATADNIAGGINDVVTGAKRLSPTQLAGGLAKCVLGIPGAVLGLSGQGLKAGGSSLTNWGKKSFAKSGALNKIAGGGAIVAGSITKAAGWLASTTGNIISGAASVAGNITKRLGYVFKAR